MATRAKELINKAENRALYSSLSCSLWPYNTMLKPLIQKSRPYPLPIFVFVFLARFRRFFTPYKATNNRFSSLFLHWVRKFFIDWAPSFPPRFFIKFRRFFNNWYIWFLLQFPTGFKIFFPPKPWSQMLSRLLELAFKKKTNCNVIKLHDQLYDKSNPIKTISYLPKDWLLINHLSFDSPILLG